MSTEEETKPEVTTTNVQGSQQENITLTKEEVEQTKPAEGPTPESLNVTQEQFDKYFKDGQYNWEAHAREIEHRNAQAAKKTEDKPEATDDDKTLEEAKAADTEGSVDWDGLEAKIIEKGDIEDTDYETLKKIGIPENVANDYVQGLHDKAMANYKAITEDFGGEAAMKDAVDSLVAKGVYTKDDLPKLALRLGDPAQAADAVKELKWHLGGSANQVQPVRGTNGGAQADGFKSEAELMSAIRDPRYKKDEAYRREVTRKAAALPANNPRAHTSGL